MSQPDVTVWKRSDLLDRYGNDRKAYDSDMKDDGMYSFMLLDMSPSSQEGSGQLAKTHQHTPKMEVRKSDDSEIYVVRARSGQVVMVGRAVGNHVRLLVPDISNHHAYMVVSGDRVRLYDQRSTYHTRYRHGGRGDWRELEPEKGIELFDNDDIGFARSVVFKFRYPDELWKEMSVEMRLKGIAKDFEGRGTVLPDIE